MDPNLNTTEVHRLAAAELNLFNVAHALRGMPLEGARMDPGTPIYDPTGEVLFYRISLRQHGDARIGYADIAAHTLFGESLLATAPDARWDPDAIVAQAKAALQRGQRAPSYGRATYEPEATYDQVRLVAFSFPKLAVQFLRGREELAMLELGTWAPVPPTEPN